MVPSPPLSGARRPRSDLRKPLAPPQAPDMDRHGPMFAAFVSNLHYRLTEYDIGRSISKMGPEVKTVFVLKCGTRSTGAAILQLMNARSVEAIRRLNGERLENRRLVVEIFDMDARTIVLYTPPHVEKHDVAKWLSSFSVEDIFPRRDGWGATFRERKCFADALAQQYPPGIRVNVCTLPARRGRRHSYEGPAGRSGNLARAHVRRHSRSPRADHRFDHRSADFPRDHRAADHRPADHRLDRHRSADRHARDHRRDHRADFRSERDRTASDGCSRHSLDGGRRQEHRSPPSRDRDRERRHPDAMDVDSRASPMRKRRHDEDERSRLRGEQDRKRARRDNEETNFGRDIPAKEASAGREGKREEAAASSPLNKNKVPADQSSKPEPKETTPRAQDVPSTTGPVGQIAAAPTMMSNVESSSGGVPSKPQLGGYCAPPLVEAPAHIPSAIVPPSMPVQSPVYNPSSAGPQSPRSPDFNFVSAVPQSPQPPQSPQITPSQNVLSSKPVPVNQCAAAPTMLSNIASSSGGGPTMAEPDSQGAAPAATPFNALTSAGPSSGAVVGDQVGTVSAPTQQKVSSAAPVAGDAVEQAGNSIAPPVVAVVSQDPSSVQVGGTIALRSAPVSKPDEPSAAAEKGKKSTVTPSPDSIVPVTGQKNDGHEKADGDEPQMRFLDVHERIEHLRDPESGGLAVYDEADMTGFLGEVLSKTEELDLPQTYADEVEEVPENIWSGKFSKGSRGPEANIAWSNGFVHQRPDQSAADVKNTVEEIPEDINISNRINWSRTGFDHLLSPHSVVVMLRPDCEKDKEDQGRKFTSRAIFVGIRNGLKTRQQFGLMKFTSKKTNKTMAAIIVPPTDYSCEKLNIPWHERYCMDTNPTLLMVIGRKKQWK